MLLVVVSVSLAPEIYIPFMFPPLPPSVPLPLTAEGKVATDVGAPLIALVLVQGFFLNLLLFEFVDDDVIF